MEGFAVLSVFAFSSIVRTAWYVAVLVLLYKILQELKRRPRRDDGGPVLPTV